MAIVRRHVTEVTLDKLSIGDRILCQKIEGGKPIPYSGSDPECAYKDSAGLTICILFYDANRRTYDIAVGHTSRVDHILSEVAIVSDTQTFYHVTDEEIEYLPVFHPMFKGNSGNGN